MTDALRVSCISEKALIYLFAEENIITAEQMRYLMREIGGDMNYINERLLKNRKMQLTDVHGES